MFEAIWSNGGGRVLDETDPTAATEAMRREAALLSREAGYSVAQKCLEVQAQAERLDPSLRTTARVLLHADAWPWYMGALGEIEVGAKLHSLGSEWMVRHAVPIGAGTADIDHLAIGPGGVFAINTKHSAGSSVWVGDHVLRVNNQNTHYLTRARGETSSTAARLTARVGFAVPTVSILAFVRPSSIKDVRSVDRGWPVVVDADALVSALERQVSALSREQLDAVRRVAEDPATWHVDPDAADTLRVMHRFDRLVDAVGPNPPAPGQPAARGVWVDDPAEAHATARPARARPARQQRAAPRLSKREATRRARRREDIAKLVLLLIAGLTFPAWGPWFIEVFTSTLTP